MIRSFRNRSLKRFWNDGDGSKISQDLLDRLKVKLEAIHGAQSLEELKVPGFDFHRLHGKPVRCTIHVNGPWCVTFEWDGRDAVRVDLEQYH